MSEPQPTQVPRQDPALVKAEGEAMLELARTIQAVVNSPAYDDAANPGWFTRLFR